MTEHDDEFMTDRLRGLERRVELDPRRRERLRSAMLDEFDSRPASAHDDDVRSIDGSDPHLEPEFDDLFSAGVPDVRPSRTRWLALAAAVAVLVAGLGALALSRDAQAPAPADQPRPTSDGVFSSDALGTPLTLQLEDGLAVVGESPGLIEIAEAPDDVPQLLLVRPSSGGGDLAQELLDDDRIGAQYQAAIAAGSRVDSVGLNLTDDAVRELDCEPREPCLEVIEQPAVDVRAGVWNVFFFVDQGAFEPVIAVVYGDPFTTGVSENLLSVVETMSLGEPQAAPDG